MMRRTPPVRCISCVAYSRALFNCARVALHSAALEVLDVRLYPRPWLARGNRYHARLERSLYSSPPLQRVPARVLFTFIARNSAGFCRRRSSLFWSLLCSRRCSVLCSALFSSWLGSRLCRASVSALHSSLLCSRICLVRSRATRVRPQHFPFPRLDCQTHY